MHPSLPLLERVFSQKELPTAAAAVSTMKPLPEPKRGDQLHKPTLIAELLAEKKRLGDSYPSNIRIEPVFRRRTLKNVQPTIRKELLKMLREK